MCSYTESRIHKTVANVKSFMRNKLHESVIVVINISRNRLKIGINITISTKAYYEDQMIAKPTTENLRTRNMYYTSNAEMKNEQIVKQKLWLEWLGIDRRTRNS